MMKSTAAVISISCKNGRSRPWAFWEEELSVRQGLDIDHQDNDCVHPHRCTKAVQCPTLLLVATFHVSRPDIDEVAGGLKTDADKGKGKNNASSLEDHCPLSLKRCSAYNCGMQLCILPASSSSQVTELETPRC